ncbi:hypothetical protein KKH81_02255, partial [Patescibacteria group bacterium]|nr:hypothetical protein [Patescibacteria group bacterium]
YERFLVNHDYIVEYEGECDAETESCFVGCEDDECTETYYYSLVEKYAADVRKQCGVDITDCEDANICLESDTHCSVTYCDAESEECSETTTQEDI